MELKGDILLRGTAWNKAIDELSSIFKPRTNYMLFMLALSIGIMYDKTIEKVEDNGEDVRSVARNVIGNYDNGKLDFMFQAAIISTKTIDLAEDERLELAFGDEVSFKKIDFLLAFANFGITKIVENIGNTPIESMFNIKNFLVSTVEGRNLDIDSLPDDILFEEN